METITNPITVACELITKQEGGIPMIKVTYSLENIVKSKDFARISDARAAFMKLCKKDLPCKIEYVHKGVPVIMEAHKWVAENQIVQEDAKIRASIAAHLKAGGLNAHFTDLVLTLPTKTIVNAAVAQDPIPFMDINGIGVKTVDKILDVLRDKFHPVQTEDVSTLFHDRIRVRLNPTFNGTTETQRWVRDTIRKRWGFVEELAFALSGDPNVIIGVESEIPETTTALWNVTDAIVADQKKAIWYDAVDNGLMVDNCTYRHLGVTTNGAKTDSSVWIKEEYLDAVNAVLNAGASPDWKVTPAKHEAYLKGLQMPYGETVDVPFRPDDFEYFPSLILELKDNVAFNTLDGQVGYEKGKIVNQNAFDGQVIMHVSAKMRKVLAQRLVDQGVDEQEAERRVKHFINTLKFHSFRTTMAANKGVVVTSFDIHRFFKDNNVTTLNGRDVEDIIFFCDETVLKVNYFGEGAAYASRQDWIDAVSPRFEYKMLLKEHEIAKKDVPYQVIQACHLANRDTVERFALEQADEINALHRVDGAMRLMGRDQRFIAYCYPEFMGVRSVIDDNKRRFYAKVDKAFAGKRVGNSSIALVFGDAVAMAQHIAGLPVTGCLPVNTAFNRDIKKNAEVAAWRSPQLDTGALRIINLQNYLDPKYDKYFAKGNAMMLSVWDTNITRVRGDFDGDKMGYSYDLTLIQMIKEAHQNFGDWLTDWETFKAPKTVVTEKDLDEYYKSLISRNDLGKTCNTLNGVYNCLIQNSKTGEIRTKEASYDAVSNLTTRANNLVDASKHGMNTYKPHQDCALEKNWKAMQPMAKPYRVKAAETAEERERGGSRKCLDELAFVPEEQRVGTLNIYTGTLGDLVDRSYKIVDLPEKAFDFRKLMFSKEIGFRGMSGLVRRGSNFVPELNYRIDQGLFNSIARRAARDWKMIYSEETGSQARNMSQREYEAMIRVNALSEIEAFANACGKTLQDAYDVITWKMFDCVDREYADLELVRDKLWSTYWIVFGTMAREAARMNADIDVFDEAEYEDEEEEAEGEE